jgi:hypothetical protein
MLQAIVLCCSSGERLSDEPVRDESLTDKLSRRVT